MTNKKKEEIIAAVPFAELFPRLPKANLSLTSNPDLFIDRETGELYYLLSNPNNATLIKLNEKRK